MKCTVCTVGNKDLLAEIESLLELNNGMLSVTDKKMLKEKYPELADNIDKITDQDCEMHWNFHQTISRAVPVGIADGKGALDVEESGKKPSGGASLTADIAKDEATVLYEVLNTMAGTFNLLDRRIKKAIQKVPDGEGELAMPLVHPDTIHFYSELGGSIRKTVTEIRALNKDVNGSGDDPLAGLRALTAALGMSRKTADEKPGEDMTTNEFDD